MADIINGNARTCDKSGTMIIEDSNSRNCGICFLPYPCEINDPEVRPQWNCERCTNDRQYAQPYVEGEIIYMQTHITLSPMLNNNFITTDPSGLWFVEICDMEGNVIMDKTQMASFCQDEGCGFDSYTDIDGSIVYRSAQWFNILTAGITEECFIVRLGRQAHIQGSLPQYLWSEPFRRVWCNEKTVLLEADYPYVDQNDNFYTTPTQHWGNHVNYKAQVRFTGSAEVDQYAIEKTMIQSKVTSTKRQQVWLVRSDGIPEYVADSVANIVAGQNIYLSEWYYETQQTSTVAVEAETTVDKDNEEGSEWFIEIRLKQIAKILKTFCSPT